MVLFLFVSDFKMRIGTCCVVSLLALTLTFDSYTCAARYRNTQEDVDTGSFDRPGDGSRFSTDYSIDEDDYSRSSRFEYGTESSSDEDGQSRYAHDWNSANEYSPDDEKGESRSDTHAELNTKNGSETDKSSSGNNYVKTFNSTEDVNDEQRSSSSDDNGDDVCGLERPARHDDYQRPVIHGMK